MVPIGRTQDVGVVFMSLVTKVDEVTVAAGADNTGFVDACTEAINGADVQALVQLVLAKGDVVLRHSSDADVESVFSILGDVTRRASGEALAAVTQATCDVVAKDAAHKSELRMRILANLYNMLPFGSRERFAVFLRLVDFAAAAGRLAMLKPYFAQAEGWVKAWSLDDNDARLLFHKIHRALEADADAASAAAAAAGEAEDGGSSEARDSREASYGFLVKFLTLCEGADAAVLASADVKAAAQAAAVGFIRTATVSRYAHIVDLKAVRALEGDAATARLYALVRIFARGRLGDYKEFVAANAGYVESLGLEHATCLETIRLLSLSSLAAEHSEAVPYAAIAATLDIDVADVEGWIIKATMAGLIEARMDQVKAEVTISRFSQREFTDAHWRALQARLHAWTGNVAAMLSTLERGRRRAAAGGAGGR